eukprot:337395_1
MSTPNWQIMAQCPGKSWFMKHIPTEGNRENFIVVSLEKGLGTVRKYDINTNQWSIIMNIVTTEFQFYNLQSTALDINKNELWLIGSPTQNRYLPNQSIAAQIDLNEIKIKHHIIHCEYDKIMMIENKLHAIGIPYNNKCQSIWNSENKTFEKVTTMDVRASGLIYVKNPKHILAFGGFRDKVVNGWTNTNYLNSILKYDFKTNQWNTMNVLLPIPMCSGSCTLAINNKYVLLFGG